MSGRGFGARSFVLRALAAALLALAAPAQALANCSSPSGMEADLLYNSTHKVLQYCDGTNWIAMGGGPGKGVDDVLNGLVAWWKLDETSGAAADDAVGANDGTLQNGPVWTTDGRVNGGLNFDGTNDYVSVADAGAFTPTTSGFSTSAWVYFRSLEVSGSQTRGSIVNKMHPACSGQWEWGLYAYAGNSSGNAPLTFATMTSAGSDLSVAADTVNLTFNRWYHVAGTVDANGVARLYVDGTLVATGPSAAFPTNTIQPVNIGKHCGSGNQWEHNGFIDDVRIYNRTLSAAEVMKIYKAGGPRCNDITSGLVGHWKFDESGGSTAVDSSGSGNTGTLTNMDPSTDWVAGKVGNALDFDGSNDYVSLGNNALGNLGDLHTVTAWVKMNPNNNTNRILAEFEGGVCGDYQFYIESTNVVGLNVNDGNPSVETTGTVPDSTWTMVTAVSGANNTYLYITNHVKVSFPLVGSELNLVWQTPAP
jgi:Concanavalin A-like lectin/glucanases superfamily